jgi:hypothetical protein
MQADLYSYSPQLSALVARRRGLNTRSLVNKLMTLLGETDESEYVTEDSELDYVESKSVEIAQHTQKLNIGDPTPRRAIRRFQSQPYLTSDQKRRRHFSFEPGEDHIQAFKKDLTHADALEPCDGSLEVIPLVSSDLCMAGFKSPSEHLISPYQIPNIDLYNASKIPSPVQVFGSIRREPSILSLRSTLARPNDGRHNSQSSILTAFREHQNGILRPSSSSRSSSNNNLRSADISPSSKVLPGSVVNRSNIVKPTGAKATNQANQTACFRDGSPARSITRPSTTSSSLRTTHNMGLRKLENNESKKHG